MLSYGVKNEIVAEQMLHNKYLSEFRVDQCPLFLQHKCQQHRPFTCFNWHFQNQKRRRPIKRRDNTFNYSADIYCEKYDETTGICPHGDECPLLHRTAGDTERRYHLRYYKTGMCVHDTDNRGYCVKNGPHCAFAHGANELRTPVYEDRDQLLDSGDDFKLGQANSLDKERSLINDDPVWLDTTYVLANYKTESCKKPPRLCRQGYACPQFHNNKDRRRSPRKYKYRSTPCPSVKSGDEWGDPVNCDAGDNCQYCHTRTEQQFHPEIYKSTKCNDIQNTRYCPRGAFCAFAHLEPECLENGPSSNLSEILNKVLPDSDQQSSCDSQTDGSSNSGEIEWGDNCRAPGSHLTQNIPQTTSNLANTRHIDALGNALDDLSINDLYEGGKSRKSSGFSETLTKSRNCSGLESDRDRNMSGNSIEQGLVSSGFLSSSSTNPVNIPGSGDSLHDQNDGFALLSTITSSDLEVGPSNSFLSTGPGSSNLGFSGGLFDFGQGGDERCGGESAALQMKNVEICRLREELGAARAKLQSWEESMGQARTACDAWKKEVALANKRAEMAMKEKDLAVAMASNLQKELEQVSGHPLLRALSRVMDLPSLPPQVLKTLEWTLRKDIEEIKKAQDSQSNQNLWMSNNRLLEGAGLGPGQGLQNNQGANINDLAGLGLNMSPLYNQKQ